MIWAVLLAAVLGYCVGRGSAPRVTIREVRAAAYTHGSEPRWDCPSCGIILQRDTWSATVSEWEGTVQVCSICMSRVEPHEVLA